MPWVALGLRPVYAGRRNNAASYSCSTVEAPTGSTILPLPATLGRVNILTCWWQWCPNKKSSCCDCPEYCRGWRKKDKDSEAYSEWLSREMLRVDIDGELKRVGRRWAGTNSSLISRDESGALWDWIISVPPGSSHSIQTKQLRFRIQLLETLPTSRDCPKTPKRTTSSCQDDWRRAKTRGRTAMERDRFWIREPALEPKETSTAIKAGQPLSFLSAPDESSQESRQTPMPVDWTLAAPQCPVPTKAPLTPSHSFGAGRGVCIVALSSAKRAAVAEPLDSAPDSVGFCTQDSLTKGALTLFPRDQSSTITHQPPKVPPVTPATLPKLRRYAASHDVAPRRLFATQNDSCNANSNGSISGGSAAAMNGVQEKSLSLPSNTSSTGTSCRLGTQPESLEAMLPVRAAGETAASAVLSLPWESDEASSDAGSKLGAAVATVDTGPSRQNTLNREVGSALLVNVRGTTTPLERVAKCCDLSRADWMEIRRQTSAGTLPHVVAELVAAMNRDEASPGSGQFCIPSLVRDCQVSGFDSRKKNS
jgi:hypothetical protein